MGVAPGREWDPFVGLSRDESAYRSFLETTPFAPARSPLTPGTIAVPDRSGFPRPEGRLSTQMAFGRIMNDLARTGGPLADAILTTSPDVTVSTNLGGFVNQRGLFARHAQKDTFRDHSIPSPQRWEAGPTGQHLELGIAEHNLFLLLAAAGLAGDLFGERVIPVGTVYDSFINRGLDALNYACYQNARFLLAATPSGITLAPEGGAHQSIHTPLIGMAQPGLSYFEPSYADELAEIMRWAFSHLQEPDGGSVYLRLSTRPLDQPEREITADTRTSILEGAYWRLPPGPDTECVVVYTGALAPEAEAALSAIREDVPDAGLLAVTSADRLHRGWTAALNERAHGRRRVAPVERLLSGLGQRTVLVTVVDGPPAALSWLGGVRGQRVAPLGVEKFGQSGDLPDLYRAYRLDEDALLEATAVALAPIPRVGDVPAGSALAAARSGS
jgi:pyruvate dehydrogenase E1 component